MPSSYPSQDLTNQPICHTFQNVIQQYDPGLGSTVIYFLDGLGNVVFSIPSASLGQLIITSDATSSMVVLSSSYAGTAALADVALIADQALTSSLSDTSSVSVSASYALTASYSTSASFEIITEAFSSSSLSSSWASSSLTSSYFQLPEFTYPLVIPNYTGYQAATHPSIIDMGTSSFAGHRYWLAWTPYPPSGTENPSVACSDDGINWVIPNGAPNPVITVADGNYLSSSTGFTSSFSFWSDSDAVMSPDNLTMSLMGVASLNASNGYALAFKQSTDGVNWTTISLAFTASNGVCPSISDIGSGYRVFWNDFGPVLSYRDVSYDFTSSIGPQILANAGFGIRNPWHFTIRRIPSLNTYWILYNTGSGVNAPTPILWATSSANAATWSVQSTDAIKKSGYFWDSIGFYRPTFTVNNVSPANINLYVGSADAGTGIGGIYSGPADRLWRIGLFSGIPLPYTASSFDLTKTIPIVAVPNISKSWVATVPGELHADVLSADNIVLGNSIICSTMDLAGNFQTPQNIVRVTPTGLRILSSASVALASSVNFQVNPDSSQQLDSLFGSITGDGVRPTLRFLGTGAGSNSFLIQLGKSTGDDTTPLYLCSLNSSNNPIGTLYLRSRNTNIGGYNNSDSYRSGSSVSITGSLLISGSKATEFNVGGVGSKNILFVSGSGVIGIGTPSPVNSLDVVGNISCSVISASRFFGTADTASFALNATPTISASWASSSISASYALTSSTSITAATASAIYIPSGSGAWSLSISSSGDLVFAFS